MTERHPTTLLAELTHRCPLHCPYCSNPLEMIARDERADDRRLEARVHRGARAGRAAARPVRRRAARARRTSRSSPRTHARSGSTRRSSRRASGSRAAGREKLREAGLEHIQISLQDSDERRADRIAGMSAVRRRWPRPAIVRELGFAFSINVVLHRANLDRVGEIIELAASLGRRPPRAGQHAVLRLGAREPARADADARRRWRRPRTSPTTPCGAYAGRMQILYVLPDYYESYPKPCYGGWGKLLPRGDARRPDAARATARPTSRRSRSTACAIARSRWIWEESPAFQAFRGDDWMQEPCRTLSAQGDRLRRLPLPGVRADRRRAQCRSRLHADAARARSSTRRSTSRSEPDYRYRYIDSNRPRSCTLDAVAQRDMSARRPRSRPSGSGATTERRARSTRSISSSLRGRTGRPAGSERRRQDDGDAAAGDAADAVARHRPRLRSRRRSVSARRSGGGSASCFRRPASTAC